MLKMRIMFHSVVAAGFLLSTTVCLAQIGNLRVGAAKVEISPTKEMFPLQGGQLYGSLHDPLFVRALVLDNGSAKAALISVDTTGIPYGDEVIKAVTDELKIPAERVIINATHDHNAPLSGGGRVVSADVGGKPPYFAIMLKGIVDAARQANANLQPARVGFSTGKAYINTNRDEFIGQGYHMGYAPDGPSDKTVAVVLFTKPSGEPIAIYANYAVHAVVMFRTHTQDGQVQITSDLPGWTAKYVDEHFPGAVTVWTPGAAGDQNPLFQGDYNQDAPDVHDEGPWAWGILDVQSRRLGEEIVRVTKAIQNTTDRAVIWGAKSSVTCPGQKRAEPPTPGVPQAGWQAPPPSTVKMIDGDPVTIPLQLIMVNDIAIAGVSGEVFSEIGQHVKKDSLFDRTLIVTAMPNGVGYIPTDKAFLLPSEKAVGNRIKPGCAEPAMVNEFQAMMKRYLPVWQAVK
jgi:neutral ceramidase